jgi:hypothetical protein
MKSPLRRARNQRRRFGSVSSRATRPLRPTPAWQRRRASGQALALTGTQAVNLRRRQENQSARTAGLTRHRWLKQQRRLRNRQHTASLADHLRDLSVTAHEAAAAVRFQYPDDSR